jgi:hypothetical protein
MKKIKLFTIALLLISMASLESCGPVIVSSRPSHPMPPWFYPNRVVNVRYVYFPDYTIYYDLTLRSYLYFDNGIWVTVNSLPPIFHGVNLRKTRHVRINNYFGNNIRDYHSRNTYVKGRRTTTSSNRRN